MNYVWRVLGYDDKKKCDILEVDIEELRMISTFEKKEIIRLRHEFLKFSNDSEWLSRKRFLRIPCIAYNPLSDRICVCFEYPDIHENNPDDIHNCSYDRINDNDRTEILSSMRTGDDIVIQ